MNQREFDGAIRVNMIWVDKILVDEEANTLDQKRLKGYYDRRDLVNLVSSGCRMLGLSMKSRYE